MAIDVRPKNNGEALNFAIEDTGSLGSATWSRPFTATKDPGETLLDILAAPAIPKKGDAHPNNPWFRVREYTVRKSSPVFVELDVDYQVRTADPTSAEASDPTSISGEISYSTLKTTEQIDEDINGNPIATKNGEPIHGVTKQISDLSITVKASLPTLDPTAFYLYYDSVNSTSFHGFPAGTVKVDDIQANLVTGDGNTYYDVTVVFHVRKPYRTTNAKAWWKRVKHQGFIIELNGKKVRAVDDEGKPVTQPVALKADGTEETDKTKAYWLEFQVYEEKDLNTMGVL